MSYRTKYANLTNAELLNVVEQHRPRDEMIEELAQRVEAKPDRTFTKPTHLRRNKEEHND